MIGALTNHLWQSTLFVIAAAIVAWALRKNGAHVRHQIWLIASLKFLVPFSILMSLGGALPKLTPATTEAVTSGAVELSVTVDRIAQPFTSDAFFAAAPSTPQAATNWTPIAIAAIWMGGFAVVALIRFRDWRRIRAAVQTSVAVPMAAPVPVRSSPGLLEPGVVGLWRPILLVPAGIEEHLTPAQLKAVLAHELCHVQRRDNLTSAIHMVVEAVFWFHPLVWFVGARLVDERERACDEHVLRVCAEPRVYAESILNVCKQYVESPLACVSGVSGADLKKRVTAIMNNRIGLRLSVARKVTLAIAAVLAIVLPLAAGSVMASASATDTTSARPASAKDLATAGRQATGGASSFPKFDVVSVKPCERNAPSQTRDGGGTPITSPGRLYLQCYPLSSMLTEAYLYFADGRAHGLSSVISVGVEGGPDWMKSERYLIDARTEQPAAAAVMRGPMLQAVLEDRFKLKIRRVTREMPIHELVIAKSGAKVAPYTGKDCVIRDEAAWPPPALPAGQRYCGDRSRVDGDRFIREGVMTLGELASLLNFDPPLVNGTGITAPVSYRFEYSREAETGDRQAAVIAALRNQLGLDVRASKGPRDFLVIDHAERPAPNDHEATDPPARASGPRVDEQSNTPTPQNFDVASIKPNNSGSGQMGLNGEPVGRFVATNVTLKQLVLAAYDLQDFQLIGSPDWMTKDHFDVDAKAPPGGPSNVFEPVKGGGPTHGELMLRSLLAGRFKLEAHVETREMSIYELVFAQADRKPGPGLKASTRKCVDPDVDAPAPTRPSEAPPCGALSVPGQILSGGISLADLASWLSPITGRTTIDRTGSSGRFEFVLKWTPDRFAPALSKKAGSTHWAAIDDDGPSLATALKEQLGLKLESRTGPVKVLVIDSVGRLIPN